MLAVYMIHRDQKELCDTYVTENIFMIKNVKCDYKTKVWAAKQSTVQT